MSFLRAGGIQKTVRYIVERDFTTVHWVTVIWNFFHSIDMLHTVLD
jgi:hypothetical protein